VANDRSLMVLLNRVTLVVSRGQLEVRHRLLPKPFSRLQLSAADIEQLYVRLDESLKVNNHPVPRYVVCARLRGGGTKDLVPGLGSPADALYIEAEVERFSRIEDETSFHEVPKQQPDPAD
jgi:hypothetical protein